MATYHSALTLHAIATATPSAVSDPAFRERFQALCELQEMDGVNMGGFCNTHRGQVTSYATVNAVLAIAAVEKAFQTTLSPGQLMELAFAREGAHHSDSQRLFRIGRWGLMINSRAALAAAVITTLAAVTAIGPLWASDSGLTTDERRLIFSADFYLLTLSWYGYVACRLRRISRANLASTFLTAATAVLFPIVSLLI